MIGSEQLRCVLRVEIDKGYDVTRIARVAFQLYHEYGIELRSDIDEKLLIHFMDI